MDYIIPGSEPVNIPARAEQKIHIPDHVPYDDSTIKALNADIDKRLKKLEAALLTPAPLPSKPINSKVLFPLSFWNKKLISEPVHSNSWALSLELGKNFKAVNGISSDPWINSDGVAMPVYFVSTDIPKVSVRLTEKDGSLAASRPALKARFAAGFRIPTNVVPATGSDHQFAVYDMIDDIYMDGWLWSKDSQGWKVVHGGFIDNASTSNGVMPVIQGERWGATATGLPAGAGIITLDDLKSGVIAHKLAFAMPFPSNKFKAPATASDGIATAAGIPLWQGGPSIPWTPSIAEGQMFRLPEGYVINSGFPPVLKMILTALRDYGMILVDKSGCFCFATENALQYGVTDILGPYMAGKKIWDIMPLIPLHHLVALA